MSRPRRTFKRIRDSFILAVVGWTILRAAVVWGALDQYGVNPWIFLALDVATVPPYVWGIEKMIRAFRGVDPMKMVYTGGVVALAAFVAPYTYMFSAGHAAMPMVTKVLIVIIIVALFGAGPIREVVKKRQNR